jgi:hypothetical protein
VLRPTATVATGCAWFDRLQRRAAYACQALLLDRALMQRTEDLCIASLRCPQVDARDCVAADRLVLDSAETLRVLLARRFPDAAARPDLRELPVSWLRLYFSGHRHFHALVARLPHHAFYHLLGLARSDGHRYPALPAGTDTETRYRARRDCLTRYLVRLLDLTLCSFERTLEALLRAPAGWLDAGLLQSMREDAYWRAFPQPDGFAALTCVAELRAWLGRSESARLWYCSVWRCNVTLLVEKFVKPWSSDATRDWLLYRLQLYRDTHLDLWSAMLNEACYADGELVARQLLQTHYPSCQRVCCAEELPDLTPYQLDNFKTGSHLKERSTLHDKLGHLYIIKRYNNICKDRNDWEIIRAYGEQDPLIYDHLKYTVRCVLLGNLPGARGFLSALARVRINLSFWPQYADRVLERAEIDAYMHPYCHPYLVLERRRDAKLGKEQAKKRPANQSDEAEARRVRKAMAKWDRKEQAKMLYEKTHFKMWLIKCRYFVSSLLKEALFYLHESNGLLDRYLSLDFKWLQYKQITRMANGQCRLELSTQASDPTRPFDWSVIEHIEKSPDVKYDIKRGKIMVFHNAALKVAKKVLKRNFLGIVEVKATGVEESLALGDRSRPLESVFARTDEEAAGKPTLEELHFLAYCLALDRPGDGVLLRTSLLQMMGMSRQGVEEVRDWMVRYYAYDKPDDSLKRKIQEFYQACPRDYLVLKTALRMVPDCRARAHQFALPAPWALRQLDALRRRVLNVQDWEPTPEELGRCYLCHGCQKFANGVVKPQAYRHHANHCELVYARHRVYSAVQTLDECFNLTLRVDGRARHLGRHRRRYAAEGCVSKSAAAEPDDDAVEPVVVAPDDERAAAQDGLSQAQRKREEDDEKRRRALSFLNVAFYNPEDGQPYCIRNRRSRVQGGVWSAAALGDRRNVIMTLDEGRVTVSCNLVPVVGAGESTTSATVTTAGDDTDSDVGARRGRRSRGGDEDDEGGDDSDAGGDDSDDSDDEAALPQPLYETEMFHLFSGDMRGAASTRRDREQLQQFARAHTQELAQNMQMAKGRRSRGRGAAVSPASVQQGASAGENNKKRIMRLVQEPIRAWYNCQVPLQPVDMVGVVKNGKVLCVECGCMTEYRNHNMTHYGPVCMQHLSCTMQADHPTYRQEAPQLAALLNGGAQRQRRAPLHPSAVPPDGAERRAPSVCRLCALLPPVLRLVMRDERDFALRWLECCHVCAHNLRPLQARHAMLPLRALRYFAEQRKYKHTLY